jgi:hypothetical protein
MSQQQMDFNEPHPEQEAGYSGYQNQSSYHDPFVNAYGQKAGQASTSSTATAGQRLALAIVSVATLVGLAISLFSSTNLITAGIAAMVVGLIVVLVVAMALVAINFIFNRSSAH